MQLPKIHEEHIYFDSLKIPEPSPYDWFPNYAKIRTPYSTHQFKIFLDNAGLLDQYPKLCFKLTHGFPLGNLAPVLKSYCPPNLPSADFHSDVIREYITNKLRLRCFTGPYMKEGLEQLMGPFCSSPFQVAMKVGACGQPSKYCVCHHLSFKGTLGRSINNDIDPKEYPTRWGKATDMAKIVHLYLSSHTYKCTSLCPSFSSYFRCTSICHLSWQKILILELYSENFLTPAGISDISLLIWWMSLLPGAYNLKLKRHKSSDDLRTSRGLKAHWWRRDLEFSPSVSTG